MQELWSQNIEIGLLEKGVVLFWKTIYFPVKEYSQEYLFTGKKVRGSIKFPVNKDWGVWF